MSRPVGLQPDDLATVMDRFGVSEAQVRRDHAISHVLGALSKFHRDDLIFFGGTALSRTYLSDERLSEDVDLIAVGDREATRAAIAESLRVTLARTHGRVTWSPEWSRRSDVESATLMTPSGIAVKMQLLSSQGYEPWPTSIRDVEQRYQDAPPAKLRVPTLPAFAGWKLSAWIDRHAARDLYDLWALSKVDALNAEAAALFVAHGPTGGPPKAWMFDRPPTTTEWQAQLGGQTCLTVTAEEALHAVRLAWGLGEEKASELS